jgi:hydrogenase maturation factor
MEQGSLNELVLTRSAIKHIRKHDKEILKGAAVGNDFSQTADVIMTEGVHHTPFIAWTKAFNNFATSGGKALGVRLEALLPESVTEADVKTYMGEFNRLADENGISILGGHTEVRSFYEKPSFVVVVVGTSSEERFIRGEFKAGSQKLEGMDIIMAGNTGTLGTDLIIGAYRDELEKRFSKSYIQNAIFGGESYSVKRAAELIFSAGDVFYMHDVSHGGLYGALWQLSVNIKKGISVRQELLLIRQETIEICEYFNLNPYLLEGTGCLLAVVRNGENACEILRENGVETEVIGKVTADNDKAVLTGEEPVEKRFLNMVSGDEIFKLEKMR